VVVSSSSARKAVLMEMTLPSVPMALVHLLNTNSAAPCTAVSTGEGAMSEPDRNCQGQPASQAVKGA